MACLIAIGIAKNPCNCWPLVVAMSTRGPFDCSPVRSNVSCYALKLGAAWFTSCTKAKREAEQRKHITRFAIESPESFVSKITASRLELHVAGTSRVAVNTRAGVNVWVRCVLYRPSADRG